MSPAYFLHASFTKMSISRLLKSIVSLCFFKVIFLKNNSLRLKETWYNNQLVDGGQYYAEAKEGETSKQTMAPLERGWNPPLCLGKC